MKNVFVTGATGYIGQELCRELAARDYLVKGLYRSEGKANALRDTSVQLVKGDLLDMDSIEEVLEDCDEIYHLAAFAAMWAPEPGLFYKINVQATIDLLTMARDANVKRIVVTSTAGVLGPSNGEIVDENTEREIEFFSEYERTKHMAEQFIMAWDSGDMEVVIVNPSRVFGPGLLSISNGATRMIQKYIKGNFRVKPGNGKRIGNYCFVEDVVQGQILAMEKGRHKERYILGGNNVTFEQFISTLSKVSGKHFRQIPIPVPLIKLAARFYLMRAKMFGIPPLMTPKWADKFNNYHWALSSQKAEQELDYRITPLEKAMQKTVKWLKDNSENI